MKENENLSPFFDTDDYLKWKKEWIGMPEFVQEDLEPIQQIIISFATREDVQDFSKLIRQKLTHKTKSVWYPKVDNENLLKYLYVDKS